MKFQGFHSALIVKLRIRCGWNFFHVSVYKHMYKYVCLYCW